MQNYKSCLIFLFLFSTTALFSQPVVTTVSNNFGPSAGGNSVSITGNGFTDATQVYFGAQSASFTVNSDVSITVNSVPGEVPGTVNVTVTTASGTSSITPDDQYTYQGDFFAYVSAGLGRTGYIVPIDLATNTAGAPFFGGSFPRTLAITPDRQFAFVTNGSTVTVVDLFTQNVIDTITIAGGSNSIAISPDGTTAFVVANGINSVYPIDVATLALGTPILVGFGPFFVAFSSNGAFAYVTNEADNTVSVINVATRLVTTTIFLSDSSSSPFALAVTPDGKFIYVIKASNATGPGNVAVIDTTSNTQVASIPLSGLPLGICITPDNRFAYVTVTDQDIVSVIDLSNNTISNTVMLPPGSQPEGIASTPDSQTVYVANAAAENVTPIPVSTNIAGTPISLSGLIPFSLAITPDQAAAAQFTFSSVGLTVQFDASLSRASVGTISKYAWDFGDGTSLVSTSPNVSHAYTAAGTFTVVLTVTDSANTSLSQTYTGQTVSNEGDLRARLAKSVTIVSPPPPPPPPPPAPTRVLPPRKFHGKIVVKERMKLHMHWEKSHSSNVLRYEIFAGKKKIAHIAAKHHRFRKTVHPIDYFKNHLKKYGRFLHHRYKIRAVNKVGVASKFVPIKIVK